MSGGGLRHAALVMAVVGGAAVTAPGHAADWPDPVANDVVP